MTLLTSQVSLAGWEPDLSALPLLQVLTVLEREPEQPPSHSNLQTVLPHTQFPQSLCEVWLYDDDDDDEYYSHFIKRLTVTWRI